MQRNVALMWAMVMSLVLALRLGAQQDSFALTIMHSNDVNAEHEPDSNGDGGAARQASVVRQIRAEVANSPAARRRQPLHRHPLPHPVVGSG